MSCYTHSCRCWLALKHFWNPPDIRASNCQFCVYNAVNCAETTIRYVVYFTNFLLCSITTIIFDSITLTDLTLRESIWTLFWSCRNHAYYLLIALFLICQSSKFCCLSTNHVCLYNCNSLILLIYKVRI